MSFDLLPQEIRNLIFKFHKKLRFYRNKENVKKLLENRNEIIVSSYGYYGRTIHIKNMIMEMRVHHSSYKSINFYFKCCDYHCNGGKTWYNNNNNNNEMSIHRRDHIEQCRQKSILDKKSVYCEDSIVYIDEILKMTEFHSVSRKQLYHMIYEINESYEIKTMQCCHYCKEKYKKGCCEYYDQKEKCSRTYVKDMKIIN